MFEAVQDIWEFLTSRNHPLSAKASIGGIIIMAVVICELATGLISGFINSQRIAQVTRIENALLTPNYDDETIKYLRAARKDLIARGIVPSFTFMGIIRSTSGLLVNNDRFTSLTFFGIPLHPVLYRILHVFLVSGFWIAVLVGSAYGYFFNNSKGPNPLKFTVAVVTVLLIPPLTSMIPVWSVEIRFMTDISIQAIAMSMVNIYLSRNDARKTERQDRDRIH